MRTFSLFSLVATVLVASFAYAAVGQDTSSILGKWEYQSGSFRDVHEFLAGGKMGNSPGGTWVVSGGQLVVRWPNGWVNTYGWASGASRLTGIAQGPNGERQNITLVRQGTPPPPAAEQISGKWEYQSGSFRDVHEFLAGGKMGNSLGGTWVVSGGQLVVHWPNGWTNTYGWVSGATRLTGLAQGPNGERQNITLVRQGTTSAQPPTQPQPPPALINLNGSWGRGSLHIWQEGNQVRATATWRLSNGRWVTWWGEGTLAGQTATLTVRYSSMAHDSPRLDFKATFKVSPDGNTISASFESIDGMEVYGSPYSRDR
jgi:hypothetical protein